ncbi:thiol-disulfide oxidoreductase DCC family protein [Bacillus sp. V5-8f]|uniref:thiol-disulfide oxidoreductase DCC family protein n=1 Tax=Bacillus sp. V5-8f TaxID=2053044 RepID=UPI000C777131|nr:DUF393 domain-containing protein [Bacillus sp. V5-8f]PLT32212.1 DUF393 domain-containing protein [Bacillus sp. V5-8f]
MSDIALYDADCILCRKTKQAVSTFDWLRSINWVSLQEYEEQDHSIQFNRKQLREEMHLVTKKGKVLKGFYAVRRIMIKCPLLSLFGVLGYIPFAPLIGVPLYRFIAARRYLFLGIECKDGKCSL